MRISLITIFAFIFTNIGIAQSNIALPINSHATRETKTLLSNLYKILDADKTVFGQQDATLYGRYWTGEADRSDVKDITGQHPGLVGFDFEKVTSVDSDFRKSNNETLVEAVKRVDAWGGIVTFAWHAYNPANDGDFYWDKNPVVVVKDILPLGKLHDKYKTYLQQIAIVTKQFKDDKGNLIPIIFRPFHEFDGEWFWWGKGHCTKEEFIALWQFTIDYLCKDLVVNNMLFAFSPDCRFNDEPQYLDYYPGDKYVDILGMDNYWDFRPDGNNNPTEASKKLKIVVDVAKKKQKLPAFTETGLEGIPNAKWFSKVLLPVLRDARVAYVMIWRNANDISNHYYTPTKSHPAAKDFNWFCSQSDVLLQNDLNDIYKTNNK